MGLTNWFKSKTKGKFHLDEPKKNRYNIFHAYCNFSNTLRNRSNIKHQFINKSECNSRIICSSNEYIFKVKENSNRFFRNHAPNISKIINELFGKDSLYSSIGNFNYRDEFPVLQPAPLEKMYLAVQHLESGYNELNSARIKVEEEVNTKIKDLEKSKVDIESKIKHSVNLNKFIFRKGIDESLPNSTSIQNIYNSNLFFGIVDSLHYKNKYLKMSPNFLWNKDSKGQDLPKLDYVLLSFISQINEHEKYVIAIGSEEDIEKLTSEIQSLIDSNYELKELVDKFYNNFNEILNNKNLMRFINSINELHTKIYTGEEKLKGKCKECPKWLDYFD